MKRIKRLPVAIAAFFMVTLGACEIGLHDNDKQVLSEDHVAFEQALNQVLVRAGEKLSAPGGNRFALGEYFRSAYVEVFEDDAELGVFDLALSDMAAHRQRKEAPGFAESLVAASDTPEEALKRITDALTNAELDDELVIELLVVRQTILFMEEHHQKLDPAMPAFTMGVLDGEHNDEGERGGLNEEEDDSDPESWWSRWGSCAAGMVGSAGDGALKGCGVGFVIGGPKGCAIGATVGAVVGAIGGAADYC